MPHFEIHVSDVTRAKSFYTGLFGWSFSPMPGGEDVDYHLIEGTQIGMSRGVTGGLMARTGPPAVPGAPIRGGTMTFDVDDCDVSYRWALENGGAEAMPPTDFPGVGRCATIEDGEGNIVGIISPVQGDR